MAERKEGIRDGIELSKSISDSSESNQTKMAAIRSAIEKQGPLYCRAVVPAFAVKDFENGFYAPWYVAHVDADMISDKALARLAGDYADRYGYLFGTDGLSAFMKYLEQEHGYIGLFTYHDGYCTLASPG